MLREGFAFIPIDAEFLDANTDVRPGQRIDQFVLLSAGLFEYLLKLSRHGRIAYVETDYFGGNGGQGAVVFDRGTVILDPEWATSGSINRALQLCGAPKTLGMDEFDSVGLGEYRDNDDWLDSTQPKSS